jgi:Ca2+-binding EF-hand superfamily protein
MADIIEVVVANFIKNVWQNYDKNNSGTLDLEEARAFIKDLTEKVPGSMFSNKDFELLFAEFDKDKSGCLEKTEAAAFTKRLLKVDVCLPEASPAAVKKGKKGAK